MIPNGKGRPFEVRGSVYQPGSPRAEPDSPSWPGGLPGPALSHAAEPEPLSGPAGPRLQELEPAKSLPFFPESEQNRASPATRRLLPALRCAVAESISPPLTVRYLTGRGSENTTSVHFSVVNHI